MAMGGNSCGGPGSDLYKTPSTGGGRTTSDECEKKGHNWKTTTHPNPYGGGYVSFDECKRCGAYSS